MDAFEFFDPRLHSSSRFDMGGAGHLALVLGLFGVLAAMVLFRSTLPKLRVSRVFMSGTAAFVLVFELVAEVCRFGYGGATLDLIPLHLCASLKIAITILVLRQRYDLVKALSIWSIGAGFISFANLNLDGGSFENFAFWHYLVGHLYLFALPVFLFLTGDFRYTVGYHLRSMFGLFVWSLFIFCVNWALDANYMYSGPHNDTVVAFLPARLSAWPNNYVSYLVIGVVLLSGVFALLSLAQRNLDEPTQPERLFVSLGSGR